jgi:hypothetical protein
MKLTKFIKKNKTMLIVVITVIIFFISFQKWNNNNMTTEHYNPNKQESSMMDQLLYNSTQYYNHNKNNFLAKTEASGYTPSTPKPGEHCPVASCYGDKIWTNDGMRTANIDKPGGVNFENNITDYNITVPNTPNKKYKYQENDKYIVRTDITDSLKTGNTHACEKPCVGEWITNTNPPDLPQGTRGIPQGTREIVLNNTSDNMWFINGIDQLMYTTIGENNDRVNIGLGSTLKLTVSNTKVYSVEINSTDSLTTHGVKIKSCSSGGRPCTASGGTIAEYIINFTADVDTVKTLIHSIVEIDVEKNNKLMWLITTIKDENGYPSIGRLYKGEFATTDVNDVKIQSLGLSLVEGIQKVGDDTTIEDDVTELSVSDNHVLIKVEGIVGGTSKSQYQILKKGNSKWEMIETPGEGVGLTVVSDNRLIS